MLGAAVRVKQVSLADLSVLFMRKGKPLAASSYLLGPAWPLFPGLCLPSYPMTLAGTGPEEATGPPPFAPLKSTVSKQRTVI